MTLINKQLMLRLRLLVIDRMRKVPALHNLVWQSRRTFRRAQRRLLVAKPVIDVGPVLMAAILQNKPFATGKMGKYEVLGLRTYLRRESRRRANIPVPAYDPYISLTLYENAGVFPKDEAIFDRFGAVFLDAVNQCDALAAWDIEGETEIFRNHCKSAQLVTLTSLEPYYSEDPWSAALEGKRVLVVSPFVDSIRDQYAMRHRLWDDPRILPAFDLLLVRPPFSAGIVPPQASDWFAALGALKGQMDALEYDVALIGAGAFSLPLAAHAKSKGKVGIHLGGPTQTLFGISGKRWLKNEDFKLRNFIKDSWKFPNAEETPQAAVKIEGGCYW
jgi:hypothetical protein